VLGLAEVGVDDDFFDLGGDSLLAVVALEEIGRAIGTVIPPHVLFERGTVRALAGLAPEGQPGESRPILLGRSTSAPALYMLSGIHLYRELAKHLEGRCSSYGVFARREVEALAPVSSPHAVEDLARDYVAIIRQHDPKGPYRLLGFSFAGLVAYEVARQLSAAGGDVQLLVLVDSTLPEWTGGWRFRAAQLRRVVSAPSRDVAAFVFRRLWEKRDPTGLQFRQYADDHRLGPLEERRDITNRGAAEHYMRRLRPFAGDVTLVISGERLRKDPLKSPSCGWGPYIASLDVHTLDTDHFGMMEREPYVSEMAGIIAAKLEGRR
jgi:thioesterase domain-containing protein